jgi:hypothetical protein
MTLARSNVRLLSNVNIRLAGIEARNDVAYKRFARTREAIMALNPWIKTAYGIDWNLARSALTPAQLEVLERHFPCHVCGRHDRWPVGIGEAWKLSFTPYGCLCTAGRASELRT